RMRQISGVGDAKLRDFGDAFLAVIAEHCGRRDLTTDNRATAGRVEEERKPAVRPNPQRTQAIELFRRGVSVEGVVRETGRAASTINGYLCEFIRDERPKSIAAWVPDDVYQRVAMAARRVGMEYLKPIYLELGEKVSYDEIRLVVEHLK